MEKLPIHKLNKIRKVASAAIHIAAMDPSHPALKPEIKITQAEQEQALLKETPLDTQLKKTTADFFKQKKLAAPKVRVPHERFKDFRRSENIEDRRQETYVLGQKNYQNDGIGSIIESWKQPPAAPQEHEAPSAQSDSKLAKDAGIKDLDTLGPRLKKEVEKRHQREEQAQTEERYEEYRKTVEKIEHTWDPKENK